MIFVTPSLTRVLERGRVTDDLVAGPCAAGEMTWAELQREPRWVDI